LEIEQRSGVIWTLHERKITRLETDLDPAEALEAAGLRE
jgi:hypothetical protein